MDNPIAQRNSLMKQLLDLAPRTLPPMNSFIDAPKPPTIHKQVRGTPKQYVAIRPPTPAPVKRAKAEPIVKEVHESPSVDSMKMVEGIHIDLYDYFNFEPEKITDPQKKRLQLINTWAFDKNKDIRSALRAINTLDNKLGNHDVGEAKLGKIYNWIKLRGK